MCRSVLLVVGYFIAMLFPGYGVAQTNWTMATGYGDRFFQTINNQQFARDVRDATVGRVQIDVRSGGSFVPLANIREKVEKGEISLGELNLSAEAALDPLFALDALPFLVSSYDDAALLWKLSRPAIERALAKRGLTLLYAVPWPPQGIYASQAFAKIQQMEGLRIRTYNPMTQRIAEVLSAKPVAVPLAELATALNEKRLDVLITSASSGVDTQAWNYFKYYLDVHAWLPKNVAVIHTRTLEALPANDRRAILEAAANAETRGWAKSREQDAKDRRQLASQGMQVVFPQPTLASGLARTGERLVREYLKTAGPEALGILLEFNHQQVKQ